MAFACSAFDCVGIACIENGWIDGWIRYYHSKAMLTVFFLFSPYLELITVIFGIVAMLVVVCGQEV